jgi:hypothetical protein
MTIHSLLRWAVIVLGILAILRYGSGVITGAPRGAAAKLLGVLTVITLDLQLLVGLGLHLVVSPTTKLAMQDMGAAMKDDVQRFWVVEHGVLMILAAVVIHAGRIWARASKSDRSEDFRNGVTLAIGMALILLGTPWPFRADGIARGWLPLFGL